MILAVATSKEGSGKSTLATLIASELAMLGGGFATRILCVDPQHSAWQWAQAVSNSGRMPKKLEVDRVDGASELRQALAAETAHDCTIIDPHGTLDAIMMSAIRRADLVIVPCRTTFMDVHEALKVFDAGEDMNRSTIRLVLNDVKWIVQNTSAYKDCASRPPYCTI